MITLLLHLLRLLPFLFGGHRQLALENLALRQQLVVYKRTVPRPRLRTTDRLLWVGLATVWAGWRQALVIVSPNTRPTVAEASLSASTGRGSPVALGWAVRLSAPRQPPSSEEWP